MRNFLIELSNGRNIHIANAEYKLEKDRLVILGISGKEYGFVRLDYVIAVIPK